MHEESPKEVYIRGFSRGILAYIIGPSQSSQCSKITSILVVW